MMEVDDVDTGLLEQFGCMQTLDHDDLISQMMRLVDANINISSAKFYLEMNQWNVQAAVCSYFDLESGNARLPGMTLVSDVTVGEGESIPPATRFLKTWRVQNTGVDAWPPDCVLRFTSGEQLGSQDKILVGALDALQSTDISVEMTSPSVPGMYESKWRMSTAQGNFFGDTIWVIISVEECGTMAIMQQFSNLNQLGSPSKSSGTMENYNPFRSPDRFGHENPDEKMD